MMSKTMKSIRKSGAALVLLSAAVGMGACDEDPTRVENGQAEREELAPGVHAMLSAPELTAGDAIRGRAGNELMLRAAGGTVTLQMYLMRVEVDSEISSYQVQLRYDTELMEFVNGTVPQGIMGTFNEPEPGRLRMVGLALDGMPEDGTFGLEFTLKGDQGATELVLEVEELTGDLGSTNLTEKSIPRRLSLVWGQTQTDAATLDRPGMEN